MSTSEHHLEPLTLSSTQNIPVVKLTELTADASRGNSIQVLGDACSQTGFVAITDHNIDADLIQAMRIQTRAVFNLPMADKMALLVSQKNYRGFIPLGFFSPNGESTAADHYEGYKLHYEVAADDPIRAECDLYGPNKWPQKLPELKQVVDEYWQACDALAMQLLVALAEYLETDSQPLRAAFSHPLTNMTLLHYPSRSADGGAFGIHPHKDTDVLTILAPDPVGGLFVRARDASNWIEARAPEGGLIVNVGDMLEVWSGGRFVSTPHKVLNSTGGERYSFPFFLVPRYDVTVLPLLSTPNFHERSMHVGDVSTQIWTSNWPDAKAIEQRYDPAIRD